MAKKKVLKLKQSCGHVMNPKEVIDRLIIFNSWRTGEDDRTMEEAGIIPSQITKDINFICEYCKKLEREIRKADIYMDIDFREIQELKHELKKLKGE